jgi:hypothetical protein
MNRPRVKRSRRPLRLDRAFPGPVGSGPGVDLEVLMRAFRDSLPAAGLFRRPPRRLPGRRAVRGDR